MGTRVQITVIVSNSDDKQYNQTMCTIESAIKEVYGVESVDVGIGEENDD